MLLGGRGVSVIDIGFGALKHRPAVGIGLIGNGIGGLLPLGVCINKLLGAAINGLLQLFLKVTADHYAVFLTLNNKAADIGDHGAAVHHIAVGVQLIGLSVCLKGVFAIYIGLQGRRLYVEAGLCLTVGCTDDILVGDGNGCTVHANGIEIIALLRQGIGHILIVKGVFALHLGQQELCLLRRTKLLPLR